VPLFDCVPGQRQTAKGKPKTVNLCPHCHAQGHEEEIRSQSKKHGAVPVLVSYLCQQGCKPHRAERRYNDPDPKKRQFFQDYDLAKIAEIEAKTIPHWYPPQRMMNVESDTDPWGDKWRSGTSNFRTVAALFTKRNLWALAAINEAAGSEARCPDILRFALTGCMLNCSRMYRYRPTLKGGFQAGTYYLPQESQIINAGRAFADKVRDLQAGLPDIPAGSELSVSTQDATSYAAIQSNTIDYVFTDPPYAGKVQYGELNFVWEAWLGFDTHWHDREIIVNSTRGKSEADWAVMMRQAMSECFRVLKPGRWISLCYHDTSEGTWQVVQDLMTEVGFVPDRRSSALFIDTGGGTYNQLMAEKVTKRDLVINFRRPGLREAFSQLVLLGDEDPQTFADKARAVLRDALERQPGSTADRLYDELVSHMVRKGQFERHDFEALLRSVAEPVREPLRKNLFENEPPNLFGTHELVRWYLRESAEQLDEAESAKEVAAAQQLEAFMRSCLREHPEQPGVHYSHLFEQYLPVQDKPRRLLADWLPEFFFCTPKGTWRPPGDVEERQQKAALRASGALRRIKRFANALLAGVPPHPRDAPENAATAADWLRQCRRAGLHDLGRVLYEKGGVDFSSLPEDARLQVEEDYQLCVRRGS
jgi:hypothetical protein